GMWRPDHTSCAGNICVKGCAAQPCLEDCIDLYGVCPQKIKGTVSISLTPHGGGNESRGSDTQLLALSCNADAEWCMWANWIPFQIGGCPDGSLSVYCNGDGTWHATFVRNCCCWTSYDFTKQWNFKCPPTGSWQFVGAGTAGYPQCPIN